MDPIQTAFASAAGRSVLKRLGVAPPPVLRRHAPGQSLLVGVALLAAAPGGRLHGAAREALDAAGARIGAGDVPAGDVPADDVQADGVQADGAARSPAATAGADGAIAPGRDLGALVYDASGITRVEDLVGLRDFFAPALRRLAPGGRVLVLGTPPALAGPPEAAVAQRALEGFTRSLAKELRGGATGHLVLVAPGAEDRMASTLRFLLSARSAFVDGQVVRLGADVEGGTAVADWERPLDGCVVVVTGAGRGIGAAMVGAFARDGAVVLGVDVPPLAADLERVTARAGGSHLVADITAPDAPERIARAVRERYGALHGIVHNAGITRDRRLVNLDAAAWQQVIAVNLLAPQRITATLVDDGVLGGGGRVVGVSSISGIAGNFGQTNYATSKAGVIGLVDVLSSGLAERGITVNAVAPGFIETRMTQKVPLFTREAGRRLSTLRQGGLPVDVAETAAWMLSPASSGLTGNVVRVCGQGLIGA